jgi:hypothetical protein
VYIPVDNIAVKNHAILVLQILKFVLLIQVLSRIVLVEAILSQSYYKVKTEKHVQIQCLHVSQFVIKFRIAVILALKNVIWVIVHLVKLLFRLPVAVNQALLKIPAQMYVKLLAVNLLFVIVFVNLCEIVDAINVVCNVVLL